MFTNGNIDLKNGYFKLKLFGKRKSKFLHVLNFRAAAFEPNLGTNFRTVTKIYA